METVKFAGNDFSKIARYKIPHSYESDSYLISIILKALLILNNLYNEKVIVDLINEKKILNI